MRSGEGCLTLLEGDYDRVEGTERGYWDSCRVVRNCRQGLVRVEGRLDVLVLVCAAVAMGGDRRAQVE